MLPSSSTVGVKFRRTPNSLYVTEMDTARDGVSVMALTAEITIAEAMVRANNRTCNQTRSWNLSLGRQTTSGVGSKLADVLEIFARLEADRPADAHP